MKNRRYPATLCPSGWVTTKPHMEEDIFGKWPLYQCRQKEHHSTRDEKEPEIVSSRSLEKERSMIEYPKHQKKLKIIASTIHKSWNPCSKKRHTNKHDDIYPYQKIDKCPSYPELATDMRHCDDPEQDHEDDLFVVGHSWDGELYLGKD
jgi:hypothetical protein